MEFYDKDGDLVEAATVLQALGESWVFKVIPEPDGTFRIMELADTYHSLAMTPSQLCRLGEELIALANQESA